MAAYKQYCIHCNTLVDRDARFCPACGRASPFGYQCPSCLHEIGKEQRVCEGCGRPLYVSCPECGELTFVQEICEVCGANLMKSCDNKRCGILQFFENTRCTACGGKLKKYKVKG